MVQKVAKTNAGVLYRLAQYIDCMESQDSPALRKKGVKVVHVKQCKTGRILFKKNESTRYHPTDVF